MKNVQKQIILKLHKQFAHRNGLYVMILLNLCFVSVFVMTMKILQKLTFVREILKSLPTR